MITRFGMTYRARMAADILRTLATEESSRSFNYVLDRAILACHQPGWVNKLLTPEASKTKQAFELHGVLRAKIPAAKKRNEDENDHLNHLLLYVDAMLRELHRLPYLKIIANVNAGRAPLSGILFTDFEDDLGVRPQTEGEIEQSIKRHFPGYANT